MLERPLIAAKRNDNDEEYLLGMKHRILLMYSGPTGLGSCPIVREILRVTDSIQPSKTHHRLPESHILPFQNATLSVVPSPANS